MDWGRICPHAALLFLLAIAGAGCGDLGADAARRSGAAPSQSSAPRQKQTVLLAAGDIASCASSGDEATASLIASRPGTVAVLGDEAYDVGSTADFANCYSPSWGRFKSRTRPAPGNHEYETAGADGYFGYFGAQAGRRGEGWYSYRLGAWHIVVLNSNCDQVGCEVDSAQERWLRADLRSHANFCTLAYWHHPRFSSGALYGSDDATATLWGVLYKAGADVILSGHEHNYERFAPQTATGQLDRRRGIREFVVGTGGKSHDQFGNAVPNSIVRNNDTFGVLRLVLNPRSYSWGFVPVTGGVFRDAGKNSCHR